MRRRMTYWRELKWMIASYVFDLLIFLTKKEQSPEMCLAIYELSKVFNNDSRFNRVSMRRQT
jgi:hypothetical protein